eukprot:8815923-Alexandrium_andersonii.AAC.1
MLCLGPPQRAVAGPPCLPLPGVCACAALGLLADGHRPGQWPFGSGALLCASAALDCWRAGTQPAPTAAGGDGPPVAEASASGAGPGTE